MPPTEITEEQLTATVPTKQQATANTITANKATKKTTANISQIEAIEAQKTANS
jgi:hypothetical protein